jgi:hypothetical protein
VEWELRVLFAAWFVGWPAAWSASLRRVRGWWLVVGFGVCVVLGAFILGFVHRRTGVELGGRSRGG